MAEAELFVCGYPKVVAFFSPKRLALCYVTSLLLSVVPPPHCCLIGGFQVRTHYHIHEKCFSAVWFGSQSLPYYQIKPIWFEHFIHCWINISDNFIFLMGITERVKLSYCPLEECQFKRHHLFPCSSPAGWRLIFLWNLRAIPSSCRGTFFLLFVAGHSGLIKCEKQVLLWILWGLMWAELGQISNAFQPGL